MKMSGDMHDQDLIDLASRLLLSIWVQFHDADHPLDKTTITILMAGDPLASPLSYAAKLGLTNAVASMLQLESDKKDFEEEEGSLLTRPATVRPTWSQEHHTTAEQGSTRIIEDGKIKLIAVGIAEGSRGRLTGSSCQQLF